MKKRIKLAIYGEPGVGKSTFAVKAEKPFFITSDGNYAWLEEFGAKAEDHVEVSSWSEAKKVFQRSFDGYETIVLDLTEDLFKWCEYEYCAKNKFEHISDVGYGKGYDITRNEFFTEMCKLISLDKNIIFIMHGLTTTVKDRRGVEHTYYRPTSRMPDKLIDMLEGRVRYFLRCYMKAEEQPDGTIVKKRYLSLIPKENEFGIHRGADETTMPEDIPLDFDEFLKAIGFNNGSVDQPKVSKPVEKPVEQPVEPEVELKINIQAVGDVDNEQPETKRRGRPKRVEAEQPVDEQPVDDVQVVEQVEEQSEPQREQPKENKPLTQAERIAAIKAALAAKK